MAAHKNEFNSQTREELWEKRERSRDRARRTLNEKITLTVMPPNGDSQITDASSILLRATDSIFLAMETIIQVRMQIDDLEILINNTLDLIDQLVFQFPEALESPPLFEQRRFTRKRIER